jgi:IS30 family transposase
MDGGSMTFETNWTDEELKELHRLKQIGLYAREIAITLNRSPQSVEHKYYRTKHLFKAPDRRSFSLPQIPKSRGTL